VREQRCAVINVRAAKTDRYEFFDEIHDKTARGALVGFGESKGALCLPR